MFFLFPTQNILLKQSIFALLMIIIATIYYGLFSGISVGMGCGVALFPCLIFHNIFFSRRKQLSPNQAVKRFYWAAIFKFLSLIILFIGAAQWGELDTNIFFLAFIIMQVSCWGSYLMLLRNGTMQ